MPTTDCLSNSNHSISNNTASQSQQQQPQPPTQQNGPPHYVDLHVNAGELVSLLVDGQEQLVAGPRTITMISQLPTPPVPIPVQVPPGHMIHQIADENGTLKHIILSVMDGEESPVINLPQGSFLIDPNGELVSTSSVPTEVNTITTLPQQTNFANYDGCPVAFDATALPEPIESYCPTIISSVLPPQPTPAQASQQPLSQITSNGPPPPLPPTQPYCNNYPSNHHHHSYVASHHHHHQSPPQQQQQQQSQHYHSHQKSLNLHNPIYSPSYETTVIPPSKQQVTSYRTAESDNSYSPRSNSGYNGYNSGRNNNNEISNNNKRQLIMNDKQQLHISKHNNNVKVITNNHVGVSNSNNSSLRTGNSVSPNRNRLKISPHQSNGTRVNHYPIKDSNQSHFYAPNHHNNNRANKSNYSHSNSPTTHKQAHIDNNPNSTQSSTSNWYSHNKPRATNPTNTPTITINSPSTPDPIETTSVHNTQAIETKVRAEKEEKTDNNHEVDNDKDIEHGQDVEEDDDDDDDEEKRVTVVIDSPIAKKHGEYVTKTIDEEKPEEPRSSRIKQKKCQNQSRNRSLDEQKQHMNYQFSDRTTPLRPDSLNERQVKEVKHPIANNTSSTSKTISPTRNVTRTNRQETIDLTKRSDDPPHQHTKHKSKHNTNNSNSGTQQSTKCDPAPKVRSKMKTSSTKSSKVAQPVSNKHHQHHHHHQDLQLSQQRQQQQLHSEGLATSVANRGNTSSHSNSNNSNHNYNSVSTSKTQPVKLSTLFRQCRVRFVSLLGKMVQDSLASCNVTKFAGFLLMMFTLLAMLLALLIHVYIVAPVTE